MVAVTWVIGAVVVACGKEPVDASPNKHPEEVWDPPTAANGFHVVGQIPCASLSTIPIVSNGTLEAIATLPRGTASIASVGADRDHVYWSEIGANAGAVYRAHRLMSQQGLWDVERIAEGENKPGEIAVTDRFVYWTVPSADRAMPSEAGIRVFDKASRTVTRLTDTEAQPERLVADGASLFWVAGKNFIREWREDGEPRNLRAFSSLATNMLAVDHDAVYAWSEQTLLRVPRNGASPLVLVATTKSPPTDVAVDGDHVYWVEQGPAKETCASLCRGCDLGYKLTKPHPEGSLMRVPARGGVVETVATNLPGVQRLSLHKGIAWVTTETGVLRIDPRARPRHPTFVEEGGGPLARAASIGDALVLGLHRGPERIALLSRP